MKFHIIVFGCQMNYADSARIKAVLSNAGHTYVNTVEEADVVIFDTCSVRQKSEDKVTGKLKEIPKNKKVRITGCMIQHHLRNSKISNETKGKAIKGLMGSGNFVGTVSTNTPDIIGFTSEEMNEDLHHKKNTENNLVYVNHAFNPMFHKLIQKRDNIELFFRIDDTGFLPLIMKKLGYSVKHDAEVTNEYTRIIPKGTNQLMHKDAKTAHVPISTGCSQFCAFCIVPYARGLEKHLPVEQIVKEAKQQIANGAEEIILLGQIVNKHPQFVKICKEILKLDGLKWLRYTSPYPTYYSDELLVLHENEPKMCPHIHMPLQSGSDAVLKKMFRGYNVAQFKEFVDKIRGLKRNISITTDVIVGFCDETEEDFQGTLDLVEYSKFDMIYIGKYSTRKGTFAQRKYVDNISAAIKQERRERLNTLLNTISISNNHEEIGQEKEILINKIENDRVGGYTDNMKNVIIKNIVPQEHKLGHFMNIKITDAQPFRLFGEKL